MNPGTLSRANAFRAAVASVVLAHSTGFCQVSYQTVAESVSPAPPNGISRIDRAVIINEGGTIGSVVTSRVGETSTYSNAIVIGSAAGVSPVIAEDVTVVPMLGEDGKLRGGGNFLQGLRMNNRGDLMFSALAISEDQQRSLIGHWLSTSGGIDLAVAPDMPAPGTQGRLFVQVTHDVDLNNRGEVVFHAQTTLLGSGIWAGKPGNLELVAMVGQAVPGGHNGEVITSVEQASLNDRGEVAFMARTDGESGLASYPVHVLLAGKPGSLRIIARTGDPAPGLPEGVLIGHFSGESPSLNGEGEIAFTSDLVSNEPQILDSFTGSAILLYRDGGVEIAARSGEAAPGGGRWAGFRNLVYNDRGILAFVGGLEGGMSMQDAVWSGPPGRLRLVTERGEAVPGSAGTTFRVFSELYLANTGQLAFTASVLREPLPANSAWLFATDPAGQIHVVARQGQSINGMQAISSIYIWSRGSDPAQSDSVGYHRAFDGQGRLVFATNNAGPPDYEHEEAIYLASFPASAPVIEPDTQPVSQAGVGGGSLTLSAQGFGSGALAYQWKKNGAVIPGATSPALVLENLSAQDLGSYTVTISNSLGEVTSSPAAVTLPPTIGVAPRDVAAVAGEQAMLYVVADGIEPLSFQWQFQSPGAASFADVAGATGSELLVTEAAVSDAGRYRVRVSGPGGESVSDSAILSVAPDGGPAVEKIAMTGDPAPFAPDLFYWDVSSIVLLNNRGQVQIDASFRDGAGAARGSGSFLGSARTMAILRGFYDPGLNNNKILSDAGIVVAGTDGLSMQNQNNSGLLAGVPDRLQTLMQEGSPIPGAANPNATFSSGNTFSVNDNGEIVVINGSFSALGLFAGAPGDLAPVVFPDTPAPGTEAGTTFYSFYQSLISNWGRVCFLGQLDGPAVTAENDFGIWCGAPGDLALLVREGTAAAGAPAGAVYNEITNLAGNHAGEILFEATLEGSVSGHGIWAGPPGAIRLVVSTGQNIDGYSVVSLTHEYAIPRPLINREGQVLFQAFISGNGASYSNSLWLWTPDGGGSFRLVAREGMAAPGTNVQFGNLQSESFRPIFNGAGQTVFVCYLAGAGVDESNDEGLWMTDLSGNVRLLAREGDAFEIEPGLSKAVRKAELWMPNYNRSGGEDGRARIFSEHGELVCRIEFSDDSAGIFRISFRDPSHPFDQWASAHGLSGDAAAPGTDTDGDRDPNLVEWATGGLPWISDGRSHDRPRIEGGDLLIEGVRRRDTRRLDYSFEVLSGNPPIWRPLSGEWTMTTAILDDEFEAVSLRRRLDSAAASTALVRQRVEMR